MLRRFAYVYVLALALFVLALSSCSSLAPAGEATKRAGTTILDAAVATAVAAIDATAAILSGAVGAVTDPPSE